MNFNLGKSIKIGIQISGLKQKDLAERTGVTVQHISCLANNKYSTTFEMAEKMAAVFGVCLSDFIEWGE